MSSAACKVIICGDPPRQANQNLVEFAQYVNSGDIAETPEVTAALEHAALCQEKAAALLTKAHKALMAAGFPASKG